MKNAEEIFLSLLISVLNNCKSCWQRFFSSTMQNLSTQSMLLALGAPATRQLTGNHQETNRQCHDGYGDIWSHSVPLTSGLGAKKTIAASAVINWLLKDGVGRIARMTVATNLCQSFDSELKVISGTTLEFSLRAKLCLAQQHISHGSLSRQLHLH